MTADEMLDALGVPFPKHAIEQRQGGGGKMFDYVATETVIRFLNTTVKVWDFEITSHTIIGDVLVVFGKLTIPGLGTRSGTGVQKLQGGEDTIKGAASDCLKKCATLFGVALDLYGPDLLAGEVRDTRQTQPNSVGRTEAPRNRSTTVNTVPIIPDEPGEITSWSVFWDRLRKMGLPNDKKYIEELIGSSIGQNPQHALEKVQAWAHDHNRQAALA
jgi:hypothetical protein